MSQADDGLPVFAENLINRVRSNQWSERSAADAHACDQGLVAGVVLAFEVVRKLAAKGEHLEKTTEKGTHLALSF